MVLTIFISYQVIRGAKIIGLLLVLTFNINAQFLPTSVGVHHKKSSSVSDESFVLDFNNNDDCTTGTCSSSFYAEVPWSDNLSTYSVSMWVKSGEANPSDWRAFFNSHTPNSGGFQFDSNGSYAYRFLSTEGSQNFGANTIKTTWVHLAVVVNGTDTKLYYNGDYVATGNFVESDWNGIELGRNRNKDRPGNYYLDEVRVWGAALSESDIKAWMHKPLDDSHSSYSDLKVYFQMNKTSISGTTLLDVSGNNNNATMNNSSGINTSSSNVPVVDFISGYQNNVEAIWTSSGTSDSDISGGLSMSVSSALAETNFVVYGNNGTLSSSLPSILGLSKLSDRVWQFDETGTVSANITIDIGTATGYTGGATLVANNYKLLYKSCSMCDYSIEADGASVSNTDNITFSSVAIKDGFYSIGSTDTNL